MAAAQTTLYRFGPVLQTNVMDTATATQTAQTLLAAAVGVLLAPATCLSRITVKGTLSGQLLYQDPAPLVLGSIPFAFFAILYVLTLLNSNWGKGYKSMQCYTTQIA